MKLKFNSRKWHAWLSFAISLPILLVAITSILIAHSQALGFRDIKIYPAWLPGHAAPAERRAEPQRNETARVDQAREQKSGEEQRQPGLPKEREFTLARLIRDLHTGEAFFGRDNKWIWDDIVGGSMTFLALTGVYLWWKGQRKMLFSKRARVASPFNLKGD